MVVFGTQNSGQIEWSHINSEVGRPRLIEDARSKGSTSAGREKNKVDLHVGERKHDPRLSTFWFSLRHAFWPCVPNHECNNFPLFAYVRLSWLTISWKSQSYVIADPNHRLPSYLEERLTQAPCCLSLCNLQNIFTTLSIPALHGRMNSQALQAGTLTILDVTKTLNFRENG